MPARHFRRKSSDCEDSACNVSNESIDAQEVIKTKTQIKQVAEDTEDMIEKLVGIEDIIRNFATFLSDLISENESRV